MKSVLIIFFLLPLLSIGQGGPVKWTVKSKKIQHNEYELQIKGKIAGGWYIYAQVDAENGLDGISTSFESEKILPAQINPETEDKIIDDKIFGKQQHVYSGEVNLSQRIKLDAEIDRFEIVVHGFASNETEFVPADSTLEVILNSNAVANTNPFKLSSVDIEKPLSQCGDNQEGEKGYLTIFLLGIAGGLLALLTPCVFPMIPVTVSFFTGRSSKNKYRNGILYGLFILLIYLIASVPFHLIGNISPEIFNTISTNAWVNVFFFIVFVFFALSFFGVFEIRLPSALANTSGSKGGIFFMALTLAVVSFSCTGPILGSLLVGSLSVKGNAWELTAGMGGFGLALGLPFALFALFPSWLKALPKSGGWMGVVKKSLAFVELALAVKFLSNADLVEHWGILKREVFIGLWILISAGLALYLLGVFDRRQKFQPSTVLRIARQAPVSNKQSIFNGRRGFGILALAFTLYLIPGITKYESANLKLLSGFPPPLSYSIYGKNNIHGKGLEPDVMNDYKLALKMAKDMNKPLLIDFTGWACVNCRKMEEHVWTKPEIRDLIKDKFVLVSLYVDDREKMDDGMTIGKWNASFQAENFRQVTQPLYVILTPDEQLINHPVGYTPDEKEYGDWLKCGLQTFNSKSMASKE